MPYVRLAAVVGVSAAILAVGCSSSKEEIGVDTSDLKLTGTQYLGFLTSGDTKSVTYSNPPRYRAFGFEAKGNDVVTFEVSSNTGDAVAWITDTSYEVLEFNDDATAGSYDAKVIYTVPSGTPLTSFRAVFRDYDFVAATFRVKLTVQSGASCSYDNQTYSEGESFPSRDGCNTCSCTSSGVSCSSKSCSCSPAHEPWRNYLGTPLTCPTIRYTCPTGWFPFQNDCGCGCERQ